MITNREASVVYEFTIVDVMNPALLAKEIATEVIRAAYNIGNITMEKPPSSIEIFRLDFPPPAEPKSRVVVQWGFLTGRDDESDNQNHS